ncbi:unnamed protein product [Bursaphelenchus xylophilus]|uniref:(pine wood nematode) hypothetical protein n=1 Tax=Bursaphelenchus xylophilus TaxID=6326 RepID=A0A1I7S4E8_BURXY|nr:unnamed protein product [Bursaphelenchus xylophilus]CAG9117018.1 unnamed protein product [Bursaphelenchus xylophilus]
MARNARNDEIMVDADKTSTVNARTSTEPRVLRLDFAPPFTHHTVRKKNDIQPTRKFKSSRMSSWKERNVSTRLICPVFTSFDVKSILYIMDHWSPQMDQIADVNVYDEGISQYKLMDEASQLKFLAALGLGKAMVRCRVYKDDEFEPHNCLEDAKYTFDVGLKEVESRAELVTVVNWLKDRGYRFNSST